MADQNLNQNQNKSGKFRGIFRTRKKKNGEIKRYPINPRMRGTEYIRHYQEQWAKNGTLDMTIQAANITDYLTKDELDLDGLQAELSNFHRVILGGVNLETLQELESIDPTFETQLLSQFMRGVTKNNEMNLYVYTGSQNAAVVINVTNLGSTSEGNNKDKPHNLVPLTKLQVIPISKNVYMDLSTKGGFYYRDGNILIPFNKLTARGLVAQVKELVNKDNIENMADFIKSFNQYIASSYEAAAEPGTQVAHFRTGIEPGSFSNKKLTPEQIAANENFAAKINKIITNPNPTDSTMLNGIPPDIINLASGMNFNNGDQGSGNNNRSGNSDNRNNGNRQNNNNFNPAALININPYEILNNPDADVLRGRLVGPKFRADDPQEQRKIITQAAMYAYSKGQDPQVVFDALNNQHPSREENELIDDFIDFRKHGGMNKAEDILTKAFMADMGLKEGDDEYAANPVELYDKLQTKKSLSRSWNDFLRPQSADSLKRRNTYINLVSDPQMNGNF